MARYALVVLGRRAGSSQFVLTSQLAYILLCLYSLVLACFDLTIFFFSFRVVENGSYLSNLCLLFGIACVTVMELERDLALRNAAGHFIFAWQARKAIKGNGEESKELDRLCLTAHVTRCLGGAVCYSFCTTFTFYSCY